MTGQTFGGLTVLGEAGRGNRGARMWLTQCVCGSVGVRAADALRSGNTKSCGCLAKEGRAAAGRISILKAQAARTIHGRTRRGKVDPTYRTWQAIRRRCGNPNTLRFECWGGRGITFCERWSKFENFLADMGERPEGRSIDRINNDGNYEPGNCRWATPKEQAQNRRQRRRKVCWPGYGGREGEAE